MGWAYVILDNFVSYPKEKLCGIDIDEDLQKLDRKQLCTLIEIKYGLEDGEFWKLPSTSKIRLGCQLLRNFYLIKKELKKEQIKINHKNN